MIAVFIIMDEIGIHFCNLVQKKKKKKKEREREKPL